MRIDIEMDQNDLNEWVQLAYNKWTQEYDNLKHAKALRWEDNRQVCPKADWPKTHERMVANNAKAEAKAKRLLDAVKHLAKYNI